MQEFFLDYCLIQELSHKKSRHTYLAYARQDAQQKLVVKLFDLDCVNPKQKQEQGVLLADILLSLKHPHIIPILDIAIKQGRPYIVSEYRPHGSLGQRLERLSPERMDWPEAVSIVIQLGQALCYAHEHGIIHGNLKPENVFYHADGEVQLTDFSLTSFIDVAKLDYKSDLSTIRYMAPEQFMGKTDQQSDQYSLACLAYELITGKPPFAAAGFSSLWGKHATEYAAPLASAVPKVPMPIDLAILKALAKKPPERYENVTAFVAALERGLSAQVAGFSLSRLNASNNADAFLLDNARGNSLFPVQSISSAGITRPLPRPSGGLGSSSPGNMSPVSPIPAVPENAEEATLFEPASSPLSTSLRIGHGYEALRSYAQTTNAFHIDVSDTHADHEDLPALDGTEPQVAETPEQRKRTGALQAAAAQTTEFVPVSPARLPLLRTRKKASVLWTSVVLLAGILLGLLGSSVVSASYLPLPFHLPAINGLPIMQSGSTQTVVAYATGALPVTPTVRSPVQQRATAHPKATMQTSLQPSTHPVVTPTARSVPVMPTATPLPLPTPTPTPSHGSVQINAGGAGVGSYIADTDYSEGSVWSTDKTVSTSGVSAPAPESVYQTSRYGYDFTYLIPNLTPGEAYTVRLHFAAMSWTKEGENVFDVTINGDTALGYFDINAAAGGTDIAVVKSFTEIARSNGTILMQFDADTGYVIVSGIQVLAD